MNELDDSEKIRAENNLLKAKIIAEHGGHVSDNMGENLSAEVENQFLNNIINFEKLNRNAKNIQIRKKIGAVKFPNEYELDDVQLGLYLEQVVGKLGEHQIHLDVIHDYPDRVIYKFITEELFDYEIEDAQVSGFICHFIYEEFHPNFENDAEDLCKEFIISLFDKEQHGFDEYSLADEVTLSKNTRRTKKEVLEIISNYREQYFGDIESELLKFEMNLEEQTSELSYQITLPEGDFKIDRNNHEVGLMTFMLGLFQDTWWNVKGLEFLGVF
jgi:hypothetical protein